MQLTQQNITISTVPNVFHSCTQVRTFPDLDVLSSRTVTQWSLLIMNTRNYHLKNWGSLTSLTELLQKEKVKYFNN